MGIKSNINGLLGCIINWCDNEEEKQAMTENAKVIMSYIDNLEKESQELKKYKNFDKELGMPLECKMDRKYNTITEMLEDIAPNIEKFNQEAFYRYFSYCTNDQIDKLYNLCRINSKILVKLKEKIKTDEEKLAYQIGILEGITDFSRNISNTVINNHVNERIIRDYHSLERKGGLVFLPCKLGDTVYYIKQVAGKYKLFKKTVCSIYPYGELIRGEIYHVYVEDDYTKAYLDFAQFGKTWFLDKEEAENKLKEM